MSLVMRLAFFRKQARLQMFEFAPFTLIQTFERRHWLRLPTRFRQPTRGIRMQKERHPAFLLIRNCDIGLFSFLSGQMTHFG